MDHRHKMDHCLPYSQVQRLPHPSSHNPGGPPLQPLQGVAEGGVGAPARAAAAGGPTLRGGEVCVWGDS